MKVKNIREELLQVINSLETFNKQNNKFTVTAEQAEEIRRAERTGGSAAGLATVLRILFSRPGL